MPEDQPPNPPDERRGPHEQSPLRGPADILSPEDFQQWMAMAVSPEILKGERLELLRRMSADLARNPALLQMIERMLAEYGEEIKRISPSQAELDQFRYAWVDASGETQAIVPAAAAAALAPPAASLAAAHTPAE